MHFSVGDVGISVSQPFQLLMSVEQAVELTVSASVVLKKNKTISSFAKITV